MVEVTKDSRSKDVLFRSLMVDLTIFEQEDMGHVFGNFLSMVGDVEDGRSMLQLFDMVDLLE